MRKFFFFAFYDKVMLFKETYLTYIIHLMGVLHVIQCILRQRLGT